MAKWWLHIANNTGNMTIINQWETGHMIKTTNQNMTHTQGRDEGKGSKTLTSWNNPKTGVTDTPSTVGSWCPNVTPTQNNKKSRRVEGQAHEAEPDLDHYMDRETMGKTQGPVKHGAKVGLDRGAVGLWSKRPPGQIQSCLEPWRNRRSREPWRSRWSRQSREQWWSSQSREPWRNRWDWNREHREVNSSLSDRKRTGREFMIGLRGHDRAESELMSGPHHLWRFCSESCQLWWFCSGRRLLWMLCSRSCHLWRHWSKFMDRRGLRSKFMDRRVLWGRLVDRRGLRSAECSPHAQNGDRHYRKGSRGCQDI